MFLSNDHKLNIAARWKVDVIFKNHSVSHASDIFSMDFDQIKILYMTKMEIEKKTWKLYSPTKWSRTKKLTIYCKNISIVNSRTIWQKNLLITSNAASAFLHNLRKNPLFRFPPQKIDRFLSSINNNRLRPTRVSNNFGHWVKWIS